MGPSLSRCTGEGLLLPLAHEVGEGVHRVSDGRVRERMARTGLSRRGFLNLVGRAGGSAALYQTMAAMGLLRVPEAYAGPPGLPRVILADPRPSLPGARHGHGTAARGAGR